MNREFIISVCEGERERAKKAPGRKRARKGREGNLIFFHSIFMTQLRLTFEAEQSKGTRGGRPEGGVAEF